MKKVDLIHFDFFKHISTDCLKDIVYKYELPKYVYSKKVITESLISLRGNLPPMFEIFYAQKSNPNKNILRHINSLGISCDTASQGEIRAALESGFESEKIMFTGPSKREPELEYAVEKEIFSVNIESVQELMLLDKIAERYGKKQNILVRFNPNYETGEQTRIIGGSGVSKFGIDIEQADDFFVQYQKSKHVSLLGIHIFNSSQILDWEKIYNNTKNVINTAKELSEKYSFKVSYIDLGGGFGIPYGTDEKHLDIKSLGISLTKLVSDKVYNEFLNGVKLIFEPGRFLSGASGIYLAKVQYKKISRGKEILLIDGGIHHFLRPVLLGASHPVVNLSAYYEGREKEKTYMVAGPLCTSLDAYGEDVVLLETKPGDVIAFMNAGAYGYTESMPYFLSHPHAEEIFLD